MLNVTDVPSVKFVTCASVPLASETITRGVVHGFRAFPVAFGSLGVPGTIASNIARPSLLIFDPITKFRLA